MTYVGAPDWEDVRQPQGAGDFLGQYVIEPGHTNNVDTTLSPNLGIYKRYLLQLYCPNTNTLQVAFNQNNGNYQIGLPIYGTAAAYNWAAIPSLGIVGDQAQVGGNLLADSLVSGTILNVFGLREYPENWPVNARPPCSKSLQVRYTPIAGTVTILPALPSPQRYLIGAIVPGVIILNAGIDTFCEVRGTLNGATCELSQGCGGGTPCNPAPIDYGDGILLDIGSTVTCVNTALSFAGSGSVYYDVVT